MDCLEKRMHLINEELETYKHKFSILERQNISLKSQLQQAQTQLVSCRCSSKLSESAVVGRFTMSHPKA